MKFKLICLLMSLLIFTGCQANDSSSGQELQDEISELKQEVSELTQEINDLKNQENYAGDDNNSKLALQQDETDSINVNEDNDTPTEDMNGDYIYVGEKVFIADYYNELLADDGANLLVIVGEITDIEDYGVYVRYLGTAMGTCIIGGDIYVSDNGVIGVYNEINSSYTQRFLDTCSIVQFNSYDEPICFEPNILKKIFSDITLKEYVLLGENGISDGRTRYSYKY